MEMKRANAFSVLAIGLLLVMAGGSWQCSPLPEPKEFSTGYFPIRSFLLAQQQQFIKQGTGVQKTVLLEGQSETNIIYPKDSADWFGELAAFFEANINKPAYQGAYKVDTLFVDTDSLTRVSYIAQKPDLRVRWLHVYYAPNATEPSLLEAELFQQNLLYDSRQQLQFLPDEGYSIKGYQDVLLLGADSFAVEATFVPAK